MKIASFASTIAMALALTTVAAIDRVHATPQEAQAACTLSGTYAGSSSISGCTDITISSLTVPAGVTLDLTNVPTGATITFVGTTKFGTQLWDGPLVLLSGSNLKVAGSGTLDGQGARYWKQAQSVTRPVFFRLNNVDNSHLSQFTLLNSPFRTFSILNSVGTTLTGLTLDSSSGDGLAKNTDGFDLSSNTGIKIISNTIKNQDDCLAMQPSTDTTFSDNLCTGGHGISVGSIGGTAVDSSDTVSGLVVSGNQIINSANGLRIKTIVGLQGLVYSVTYTDNTLTNVDEAIVMHSNYDKSTGGYSGSASSEVGIKEITISGLSGTATTLYDVLVNPSVVSDWKWSGIAVTATNKGSCSGQPSTVVCP